MTKAYVVLRRGYEYNDEIHSSQGDAGEPEKIFLTKEKAEEFLDNLFHKEFSTGFAFNEYCYETRDLTDRIRHEESILDRFNKIVPEEYQADDEERLEVGPGITLEQSKELRKLFSNLELFYIVETEIE